MPVVRIPLVHKFGIISVSRAEQLLREGRRNQESSPPRFGKGEGLKVLHTYYTCIHSTHAQLTSQPCEKDYYTYQDITVLHY